MHLLFLALLLVTIIGTAFSQYTECLPDPDISLCFNSNQSCLLPSLDLLTTPPLPGDDDATNTTTSISITLCAGTSWLSSMKEFRNLSAVRIVGGGRGGEIRDSMSEVRCEGGGGGGGGAGIRFDGVWEVYLERLHLKGCGAKLEFLRRDMGPPAAVGVAIIGSNNVTMRRVVSEATNRTCAVGVGLINIKSSNISHSAFQSINAAGNAGCGNQSNTCCNSSSLYVAVTDDTSHH